MSPRLVVASAALCGTVVLAGWVAAGLAGVGSPGIENARTPIVDSRAASVPVETLQAAALGEDSRAASVPVEALQTAASGEDSRAASVPVAALQATAMGEEGVSVTDVAVDAVLP